ncbi:MAG: mechanosensitive ion channel family protein [Fidelibacterota bacterium]
MKDQLQEIYAIWGPPIITLVIGIVAGLIFKRFFRNRFKKITSKTSWQGDDIIFMAIEKHVMYWFFLTAVYLSASSLQVINPFNVYAAKLSLSLLILSITLAISSMAIGLLNAWSVTQGSSFPPTTIFTNLARGTIIAIGVMIILQSFGISITPILTALGVGGLAISLALKDTLSDFFAGLHILLSQKVRIGDFVELDSGEMGYVTNITWRNTSLKERTNNLITIPNAKLSNAITKNYDVIDPSYSVKISAGVAYDSDLDRVEKVILDVANGIIADLDMVKKDYEPIVRFQQFGDSSINFTVYMRAGKYGDHHPIKHEFIKRLHKQFNEEGIEIPFPIRTIVQK